MGFFIKKPSNLPNYIFFLRRQEQLQILQVSSLHFIYLLRPFNTPERCQFEGCWAYNSSVFFLFLFFIEMARATVAQAAVSLAFLLCLGNSKKGGVRSNFSLKWEVLQSHWNWGGTKGRRKQGIQMSGTAKCRGGDCGWTEMKRSIAKEGKDVPLKREQTPQQLHPTMTWQIYSHFRCWSVVSVFLHLNKSKWCFPSDSTVHLTEDLEYHVALKID